MSLIKCDECGKEISNKASVCIHCGNPIYSEEHTNVVVMEKSWVDLDEKEKIALICEYEEKTGFNMHFTFWECTFLLNFLIYICCLVFLFSIGGIISEGIGYLLSFFASLGCGLRLSFLSYNTWQKHRGEVSWNRVNASRDFIKWLKASKNIVK